VLLRPYVRISLAQPNDAVNRPWRVSEQNSNLLAVWLEIRWFHITWLVTTYFFSPVANAYAYYYCIQCGALALIFLCESAVTST